MQKIIGISGDAGVGKTTLAKKLGSYFGYDLPYSGFGEELRYWISKLYNIPLEELNEKPTPPAIRRLLIQANSLKKTYENESIWVDQWESHLYGRSTAVGDLRFMCEAKRIREMKGIIIFIGEPHDPWYELDDIYKICDIQVEVKPAVTDSLLRNIDRAFKSYGH